MPAIDVVPSAKARTAVTITAMASRAMAGLVKRGLVLREIGQEDAREVALRLSGTGQDLHRALMGAALERDATFEACLTHEERAVLDRVVKRLEAEARRLTAGSATDEES